MKLFSRKLWMDNEYNCAITDELNDLSGYITGYKNKTKAYGHYVLFDNSFVKDKVIPIRVIGGTVGAIKIDDSLTITDIIIDTEYVVKTYPTNVNDLMNHWIGEKIDVDENDRCKIF